MLTAPTILRYHHLNYAAAQEYAQRPVPDVPGLYYLPEFLTAEQQAKIISRLDSAEWNNDMRRRVQQYGWRYDYRARAITPDMYLGALPQWLQPLAPAGARRNRPL